MPYIPELNRKSLTQDFQHPSNPGELNFAVTSIFKEVMNERGISYNETVDYVVNLIEDQLDGTPDLSDPYAQRINAVVKNYVHSNSRWKGALRGAQLEFYARVARPYEDKKIIENGDVY